MAFSVQDLYNRYRTELKPLIAEYESENEKFVSSWLDDLSQMFDRVALSETECELAKQEEQLKKAYEHLDSAISDARRGVIASKMKLIEKYRKCYNIDNLNSVSDGKFIGPFFAKEKKVRDVKDTDEIQTCSLLMEMVSMIQNNRSSILAHTIGVEGKQTTILKWMVTILLSIISTYIISLLW